MVRLSESECAEDVAARLPYSVDEVYTLIRGVNGYSMEYKARLSVTNCPVIGVRPNAHAAINSDYSMMLGAASCATTRAGSISSKTSTC